MLVLYRAKFKQSLKLIKVKNTSNNMASLDLLSALLSLEQFSNFLTLTSFSPSAVINLTIQGMSSPCNKSLLSPRVRG